MACGGDSGGLFGSQQSLSGDGSVSCASKKLEHRVNRVFSFNEILIVPVLFTRTKYDVMMLFPWKVKHGVSKRILI